MVNMLTEKTNRPEKPGKIEFSNRRSVVFDRPRVMGILNVTPDSFSDGGLFAGPDDALAFARQMIGNGADIIDVGGESSRPGSDPVSLDEELKRVIPIIKKVR